MYQKLSKDTLWFVKKVAVEILPKITKLCDNNIILKNIMPIFKNFANEEKVEVKLSVVETLGEFIPDCRRISHPRRNYPPDKRHPSLRNDSRRSGNRSRSH